MGSVFSYNLVVYRYSLKLYQNDFLIVKVIVDEVFMYLMLILMFHVKHLRIKICRTFDVIFLFCVVLI